MTSVFQTVCNSRLRSRGASRDGDNFKRIAISHGVGFLLWTGLNGAFDPETATRVAAAIAERERHRSQFPLRHQGERKKESRQSHHAATVLLRFMGVLILLEQDRPKQWQFFSPLVVLITFKDVVHAPSCSFPFPPSQKHSGVRGNRPNAIWAAQSTLMAHG